MSLTAESFPGPRAFARHMLQGDRLRLRPEYEALMASNGGTVLEAVLFRESCWQVTLIVALPSAKVEPHRHMRCNSADLLLNAKLPAKPVGRGITFPKRGPLIAQLRTIGRGELHGESAGPEGLTYLSFQQWEGEPAFLINDWKT